MTHLAEHPSPPTNPLGILVRLEGRPVDKRLRLFKTASGSRDLKPTVAEFSFGFFLCFALCLRVLKQHNHLKRG